MAIYWNDGTSLYHYGIKGQHWGERRYQNEDGTYTEEGRRRYGIGDGKLYSRLRGQRANTSGSVKTKHIDTNKLKKIAAATIGVAGIAALAYTVNNDLKLRKTVDSLLFDRDVQTSFANYNFGKANEKIRAATDISLDHLMAKSVPEEKWNADNKVRERLIEESNDHYNMAVANMDARSSINKELSDLRSKSRSNQRKVQRYTNQYYKKNYNEEDRKKYM